MARGLEGLGVTVAEQPGGLTLRGPQRLRGGRVDSRGDHRVAMSFAVASLIADGAIEIANTAEVATSFPSFLATAAAAGLSVEPGDRAR
jgi:3-phosphoshikimate 1-carboxyvinyltransferase